MRRASFGNPVVWGKHVFYRKGREYIWDPIKINKECEKYS
jgi:hypothetical protein